MNRRSFIKGLIALASAPAIGKYVNVFKTEGAREGIGQVVGQGVDFFNMVIKKVMDEGTLVKEQDRISTYKHPDRPDITVDVDQTTGSSSVYFDSDQGSKAAAEITKTMDETTRGAVVEDLMESEEIYGPYGKDVQEGISGGITNLEKFLKGKKGFAAGGRVGMFMGGKLPQGAALLRQMIKMTAKERGLENPSEMLSKFNPKKIDKLTNDPNLLFMKADIRDGIMATDKVKDFKNTAQSARVDIVTHLLDMAKTLRSTNLTNKAQNNIMIQEAVKMGMDRKQAEFLVKGLSESIEKTAGMPYNAPRPTEQGILDLETLLKNLKTGGKPPRALNADGGRVGMFRGGVPKGLQAALRAIMGKYGDDAITTADKAPQPEKTIQEEIMDFNARNPNPNRQMTDEEITEFADEFGLDPSEDYYNWDGTLADAKRLLKEAEDEKKYMYQQYKAGRLDPKPGEKGREKFLEKKLEEAELSGESKLITRDEIQELEDLRITREMAPQMTERLELKARYPGITDDLLDSILIDDNPQRKAEVLATLDEAFAMMKKGKGPDEVLRIIKDMNRTKQADGGSIDGDVSLTIIEIPDISKSGVESLFKRR